MDPEGFRSGIGLPDMRLSMCLVVSWAMIFAAQSNGIRTSGKAAYFTSIVPYVLLLVLLIRGVTLPGAANGIMYFLIPRWEKLLDIQVREGRKELRYLIMRKYEFHMRCVEGF